MPRLVLKEAVAVAALPTQQQNTARFNPQSSSPPQRDDNDDHVLAVNGKDRHSKASKGIHAKENNDDGVNVNGVPPAAVASAAHAATTAVAAKIKMTSDSANNDVVGGAATKSGSTKNPTKKTKTKKDKDAPKKAKTAYNYFYDVVRPQLNMDPKISFQKTIGERWRALSCEERIPFEEMVTADKRRYQEEMLAYNAAKKTIEKSSKTVGPMDVLMKKKPAIKSENPIASIVVATGVSNHATKNDTNHSLEPSTMPDNSVNVSIISSTMLEFENEVKSSNSTPPQKLEPSSIENASSSTTTSSVLSPVVESEVANILASLENINHSSPEKKATESLPSLSDNSEKVQSEKPSPSTSKPQSSQLQSPPTKLTNPNNTEQSDTARPAAPHTNINAIGLVRVENPSKLACSEAVTAAQEEKIESGTTSLPCLFPGAILGRTSSTTMRNSQQFVDLGIDIECINGISRQHVKILSIQGLASENDGRCNDESYCDDKDDESTTLGDGELSSVIPPSVTLRVMKSTRPNIVTNGVTLHRSTEDEKRQKTVLNHGQEATLKIGDALEFHSDTHIFFCVVGYSKETQANEDTIFTAGKSNRSHHALEPQAAAKENIAIFLNSAQACKIRKANVLSVSNGNKMVCGATGSKKRKTALSPLHLNH